MNDNNGWTPFHESAKKGSYELIKLFINKASDILVKTKRGEDCLHIAACYGHLNICKTLIKKHNFDVHMSDKNGWTVVHCSAKSGRYKLIQFLLLSKVILT